MKFHHRSTPIQMYIISGLVGSPCTPKSKLLRRRNVTPTVPYPKMRHASHDISHTSNDTTTEDQARFLKHRMAYDDEEDAYSLKVPSEENQFNDGIIEDTLSNVDNFGFKGFQYTINTPKCHGSQENENSALVGGKKNTFLDNIMRENSSTALYPEQYVSKSPITQFNSKRYNCSKKNGKKSWQEGVLQKDNESKIPLEEFTNLAENERNEYSNRSSDCFVEKRKYKVGRASRQRHPSGIRGKIYVAGESSHDSMPPLKAIKPLGREKDIRNRSEAKCWDRSYPSNAVNETKIAMNARKNSYRAYSQPPRYTNIC